MPEFGSSANRQETPSQSHKNLSYRRLLIIFSTIAARRRCQALIQTENDKKTTVVDYINSRVTNMSEFRRVLNRTERE